MMANIREKLTGRPWPPQADTPATLDISSVAVLSARLSLEISPGAVHAKQYEEELVRNHLRMLYSVQQNRETIVTGSSPEPLIAEASAQIMHHTLINKVPYMDVWMLLSKYVDNGMAAQGAIGELIGRTLSILAMDQAINGLSDHKELKYQTPVRVTDYYKALLTDTAWNTLCKSKPANRSELSHNSGNKTFEQAFQNAYFHFSHYGKANDSSPMQDIYAWALWLRGTAITCQLNQKLTDRMYPIYFPELGNVSPTTVSVNLEQDKTGQTTEPTDVAIQSAENLSIFSRGKKMPYIAAVHCYGSRHAKTPSIAVSDSSPYNLCTKSVDQQAPRYQVDFCGLDAYRNLTAGHKASIEAMIDYSKNALFNKHPREYGKTALRQMLPVLTEHEDSSEWFGGCIWKNGKQVPPKNLNI